MSSSDEVMNALLNSQQKLSVIEIYLNKMYDIEDDYGDMFPDSLEWHITNDELRKIIRGEDDKT